MRKIRYILITMMLLFSTSCAGVVAPRITQKTPGIDAEFNPYIKEYKLLIGTDKYDYNFSKLSMNFAKLEGSTVGLCWWLLDGELEIEIDTSHWNWGSHIDRQFLVYHELEHCIRKRMHTNRVYKIKNILDLFDEMGYYLGLFPKKGSLPDGCPASLMHSHTMGWSCQQKHFQYYLNEIKNWRK